MDLRVPRVPMDHAFLWKADELFPLQGANPSGEVLSPRALECGLT